MKNTIAQVMMFFLVILVPTFISWYLSDRTPREHMVYACPISRLTSKCYKVPADYQPKFCGDGGCDAPYYETIYFYNGGYIEFEWCEQEKDVFTCYASNDDSVWEISYAGKLPE